MKIEDKTNNFDGAQALTDRLEKKHKTVAQTIDWKTNGNRWARLDKKKGSHRYPEEIQGNYQRRTNSLQELGEFILLHH